MPEPKSNSSNKRKPVAKKPTAKSTAKKPTTKPTAKSTEKNPVAKPVAKKPASKTTPKKSRETKSKLKISAEERRKFPHSMFPVKVMHMDGKDLTDLKICYFTDEIYANKYIVRSKLKKDEYVMLTKQK